MAVIQFIGDRFTGLSTDTKPSGVLLGAMFTETDTGKVFVHNGASWTEAPYLSSLNWGDIGGTISNQADLNNALAGKAATNHMQTAQYGGLGVDASGWTTGKVPKFNSSYGKFEPTDIVVDLGLNDQVSGPILINNYGDLLETGWEISNEYGQHMLAYRGDLGMSGIIYSDPEDYVSGIGGFVVTLKEASGTLTDITSGIAVEQESFFSSNVGPATTLLYQNDSDVHISAIILEDVLLSLVVDANTVTLDGDGDLKVNSNIIWHAGNDGHNSGLDADTVDGKHATDFALASHNHDTSHITTGTFADARIKESNVTQHEGALSIAAGQITGLATVATTGKYGDLTDKPDLSALAEIEQHNKFDDFPNTGKSHKVYIAIDTGYMYRWNGTGYTQLTDQTAIWGQITGTMSDQTDLNNALNGKADATTVSNHISDTNNPHAVTLVQLGDTTVNSPSNRHALIYSNSKWINRAITEADISDLGAYITSVSWGDIGGTLSNQTDLNNALAGKANINHMQTAQYGGLGVDASGWINNRVPRFNTTSGKFEPVDPSSLINVPGSVGQMLTSDGSGGLDISSWYWANSTLGSEDVEGALYPLGGLSYAGVIIHDETGMALASKIDNTNYSYVLSEIDGVGETRNVISSNITTIIGSSVTSITTSPYQIELKSASGFNTSTLSITSNSLTFNSNKIWHAGNDGHNSGLDADTLDGKHATEFLLVGDGLTDDNLADGSGPFFIPYRKQVGAGAVNVSLIARESSQSRGPASVDLQVYSTSDNHIASGSGSTLVGGTGNTASGQLSTTIGGVSNTASGDYSAILGGQESTASGIYTVAMGRKSKATHQGSVVISDSTNSNNKSSGDDDSLWLYFDNGAFLNGSQLLTEDDALPRAADISSVSGNTTFPGSYKSGTNVRMTSSVNRIFTINASAIGTQYTFIKHGTGDITISAGSGQTIKSKVGSSPKIKTQYGAAVIMCDVNNQWLVIGDIEP